MSKEVKVYLHVVYAGFGDASILEFESGGKRRFYLVDGGPVHHIGTGKTIEDRIKKLEDKKVRLTRPYYQYLLYTLTNLASIPNSKGNEIKLDGAVVTHPHADHLDGVEKLFRDLLPAKYQVKVSSDNPTKRLMCNGPVLLTRQFALQTEAHRSFSEFLLKAKFEVSLTEDDIQNAFGGNDILFTFPSSRGVLYQRHEHLDNDQPSEDEQRKKLEGRDTESKALNKSSISKALNKSSIILCTQRGGKICLTGDAFGYDIAAMLRKQKFKEIDVFKIPHHGSPKNSILGTVLPPSWTQQNLAMMLLLSISLKQPRITFEKNTEEEDDIDHLRQRLKNITGDGNGEQVEAVAARLQNVLQKRIKNTKDNIPPETLLKKMQEKHIEIVTAIQQQAGKKDPCAHLEPLKHLKDWSTLAANVSDRLSDYMPSEGSEHSTKRRKVEMTILVQKLMGNDKVFQNYFKGKIGTDSFFDSFHAKTYYVTANGKYRHPSPRVIKGIIKAAVKKKKQCRIVFTSGGCIPSNLPGVNISPYQGWQNFVSLYYLKSDVSFKLDPHEEVNKAPFGTTKFTVEEKEERKNRSSVAEQLEKNFGFTIPQRTFLPTLDNFYVSTSISNKIHWLEVKGDGTFSLSGAKSSLVVSNAPSINGDLRMIALKSEGGGERNVLLEKAKKSRFFIKGTANGGYLSVQEKSLTIVEQKNKGTVFSFDHKTFTVGSKSGNQIPVMEYLKSIGYEDSDKSILLYSVLEMLLGVPNMKTLTEQLPSDFIAITALNQEVNLKLSTVELSTSIDSEVASSHIQVSLPTPAINFDSRDVTKLEIFVEEPSSPNPGLSLQISTTLRDTEFTVNLSKYLQSRQPSVDMYLNALGGVGMEGRDNLTLGTLLDCVMGRLPLEALSNCFPTQLFEGEILTWKVNRAISTVKFFMTPLAVEVLSGDIFVISPAMTHLAIGNTLAAEISQIHIAISDPRTQKSSFVINCLASVAHIPAKVKLACSSTSLPEMIISFPEGVVAADVFKTLGQAGTLPELSVPFAEESVQNLKLLKPRMSVVQDVQMSRGTRVSSLSFDVSLDKFPSVLPSNLTLPEDSKASVTIFNPLSRLPQVGLEVEFKLPVSQPTSEKSFLNSKFSLLPIQVAGQESRRGYVGSVSLSPSSIGITMQSALNTVIPGDLTNSMVSSFPLLSSILSKVLLDQVTLEANPESRAVDSVTVSLLVPELTIVEGKLSIYDAKFFMEYANNQWYAEAETKLFVFNTFICQAAFSLPRIGVPGSLTFRNTEDGFTLKEFIKGIGILLPDDIPIINELLDVKVSKVDISCENDGGALKLTKFVIVVENRQLDIGINKLYNLQIEVAYKKNQGDSSVSFSLQGYVNPKTHVSFAYNAENRELLGHYQLTENISTNDCLSDLFSEETKHFSGGNAFDQVKSLYVQEVEVVVGIPQSEEWSIKKFVLSMQGCLALGPFNLCNLRFEYNKVQGENMQRHFSVIGQFKRNDHSLSFIMELSCTSQLSQKNVFEATIRPDIPGGLKLSSLLHLIGLKNPEIPKVDGSPNFLEIELKEAFLQFEVPFQLRKVDVVVETSSTLTILEKPLIHLQEARLEYHLDQTKDPVQTQVFIAGIFTIAKVRLEVRLSKDTNKGLVLEGRLEHSSQIVDFEQAAKQLSPGLAVNLPEGASVALTSFLFVVEKSEESTALKLEGSTNGNWSKDAGFSTIAVKSLGGKLNFTKESISDEWSGSVCLTGEVQLQSVVLAVEIYHDSKRGTIAFGTAHQPDEVDLETMTRSLVAGSDPSASWNRLVPEETESSVRSPRFDSATVYIDFADKILIVYGNVVDFGTGMLLVKRKSTKEESPGYGFMFGLSLGSDFRFSLFNGRLSVVDDILSVQQANLSVISMDNVTTEELRDDFSKLKEMKGSSIIQTPDADEPFAGLDITSISKLDVSLRGVSAYAKINFSGKKSKLLRNVTQIQRGNKPSDVILFAHIPENVDNTEFMAQIGEIKLFGGSLAYQDVTLLYTPFKKAFSLSGKMCVLLTEDSEQLVFQGNLEISESKAEFSMTVGGSPEEMHKPFGMFGISFKQPKLKLTWQFDQDHHKPVVPVYSISGTVNFFKSSSSSEKDTAASLQGLILFQEGKPVVATIALDLSHPLSIDDVFATLFRDKWPKGYLDVKFKGGEIYYCTKPSVELEVEEGKKKTYKEGYCGETHIEIFDYNFGVEMSVNSKGMVVKGYTEFEIDLIFAVLTQAEERGGEQRGPEIVISRFDGKMEFKMSAGIKLLQEKIGTWSVGYSTHEQCFLGGVTYNGELLGVSNPSIEFEWSKKNGFKIRHLPAIIDLKALIDFAKAFKELSEMIDSPCEKLVGLAFDKVIKTKCRLNVKQVSVKESQNPSAWFALELQGILDVMIGITDKPSVSVDFPRMVVAPDKPPNHFRLSDLEGFLITQILKNSLELVKQVFSQPEQLTKFFTAYGAIKLSRKVLSGLICRGVESPDVTTQAQNELDKMENEAQTEEANQDGASGELSKAVQGGASIAELAAYAAAVIAKAVVVIAALAAIVSFIKGIIRFFTGKSKEQKEAEERQEKAQKKAEQARRIVEDRLVIKNIAITSPKSDEIEVTWKPLEENIKYRVLITCTDLGGTVKTLKEETTESSKVNITDDAVKYNAKKFTASIKAFYVCGDVTFTGKEQSLSVSALARLHAPSMVDIESKRDGRELHVTFSKVKYAQDYKAEIVARDRTLIGSVVVNPSPEDKEGTHVFTADKLASGLPGMINVRICARGAQKSESEFKYSSDLYRVAAPTQIRHSYKSASHELFVEWNVSDTRNITSYFCEIFSQENTVVYSSRIAKQQHGELGCILTIHLDEIADKSKSPYQIHICALGSSEALASNFINSDAQISFLREVDGILPSYDSQTNELTVAWTPVPGATNYAISIREKSSLSSATGSLIVDGNRNSAAFEMAKISLKVGVKYIVSVVAQGSDSQHLPSMPSTSTTEFTRLPSPASIVQEFSYVEQKIKVSFQPVPSAVAHVIEVFNDKFPSKVVGRQVVPKAEVTYSFDVEDMRFTGGGRFKSRVIALGTANFINSEPCVTSTALTCSDTATSITLKYSVERKSLIVTFASTTGNFIVKVEDIRDESRTINKQSVAVKEIPEDHGKQSVRQSVLNVPLNTATEPSGATYQASVLNTGDQQHLPSDVKVSNEVPLLDPPDSVTQECKDGVFTVAWTCVKSASGYHIRVYNSKTESTASEVNVICDLRPAGKQMKKEFDVESFSLESNGVYETLVKVLGSNVAIGGASTRSKTAIPSCSSPQEVKIAFNNETRLMDVSCSPVKGAAVLNLGVVDADKLKSQGAKFQDALLGLKKVTIIPGDLSKPVEVEFDDSVLISTLDGKHKGVARVLDMKGDEMFLPSGYSTSEDVVSWLKPAVPVHVSFDPVSTALKITWMSVELALRYLVEVLQERKNDKGETVTLIPFSKEVDTLSCDASMEGITIEESDKFTAKVQPIGIPGKVITDHCVGYSSESLVCETSPTQFEVLKVENEEVKLRWKRGKAKAFQIIVWKILQSGNQEVVVTKQAEKTEFVATSGVLGIFSPGRYKFGVRAQGSTKKIHSVYTKSDVLAVIMDAPLVRAMKQRSAVTVQWTPINNNPIQDFAKYVISYLQRDTDSSWLTVDVELSATEKVIDGLQPDSEYVFCVSVASHKQGNGIRSPPTGVHTNTDHDNLLDNPNFAPAGDWDETGHTWDIITHPWQLIQPKERQYRLEMIPPGTKDARFLTDGMIFNWGVEAPSTCCWRVQTIDLLAKGFTPEYLDEVKPNIQVFEWFAIKTGHSGSYNLKVSLLDINKRDLPGKNFFYSVQVPRLNTASSSLLEMWTWDCLGHTFSSYPSGLRFIRFEDTMQSGTSISRPCVPHVAGGTIRDPRKPGAQSDGKGSTLRRVTSFPLATDMSGYYVKAFGATVKISESQDGKSQCRQNYSKECEAGVNKQINLELNASNVFLLLSAIYDDGLDEIMAKQSDKSRKHVQNFMHYQNDRGGHIELQNIKNPECDGWTSLQACDAVMRMSSDIFQALVDLYLVAKENQDSHMAEFITARLITKRKEYGDLTAELKVWIKEHV